MRNAAVAVTIALGLCLAAPGMRASDKPAPITLVVLVVVDQMRADYIDRYGHTWNAGLKRLVGGGARFSEAAYPYLNTVTCPGHATIGTGRFPARHGIILNEWWDRAAERRRACTDDPAATTLTPTDPLKDGHSGARLLAPTLAETIGESGGRIVTLALKPRSAMMMAGKRGAFVGWYDDTGTWATSSVYSPSFPAFAADHILKHPVEAMRGASWTRLLPTMRYQGFDDGPFERPTNGWTASFPHVLDSEISGRGAPYYRQWQRTPFADAYLADLAMASVDSLNLGRSAGVDFLGVSFSALDSSGHNFGPDSHEVQDVLARLDKTLGRLLAHLDARVGRGRYALALTADHGVGPIPEQSKKDGLDAGRLEPVKIAERVNDALAPLLGPGNHVAMMNYTDLFFARGVPEKLAANPEALKAAIDTLAAEPGVLRVFTKAALVGPAADSDPVQRAAALSHHPLNSGDLIMVPKPYWIASADSTTHGTMQPYDQRVPIIFFGAGVKAGTYKGAATPADVAPTLARLIGVTFGGTDGRPLIQALARDETAEGVRMSRSIRRIVLCLALACRAWAGPGPLVAQGAREARIAPDSITELRAWDARVDSMLNTGELRVRVTRDDALLPGRTHQRADQFYRGVRVWGGDVSRQLAGGQTVSVFGVLYDGIAIDTSPALTPADATTAIEAIAGARLGATRVPELVVLPIANGERYALAYTERVISARGLYIYFIDARSGTLLMELNDLKTQASAVGRGRGVLGDEKKISTRTDAGAFQTWDELRPPDVRTYDMKGNLALTEAFLNGEASLPFSEIARDSDNEWSDGAVVDAHVYSGWTYDYYFKRHNRLGLDNRNIRIATLVHPVRRQDIFTQPNEVIGTYYVNAFYAGDGILVYGEGLPAGVTLVDGTVVDFLAGALDVVAHELTHGVTQFSSDLIYLNESGALNESFSDMMSTSVEFFFQAPGGGQRQADYQIGEDVWRPSGLRSMSNPGSLGDPDHYSRRFTGPQDNGGVHINSGIPNQAFYLAIESGTNRTSGLSVSGVGAANREQIEKVFYRAFTQMLPANANFSTARAATIQSARDLYGAGGAVERAVIQAWTAVGVN